MLDISVSRVNTLTDYLLTTVTRQIDGTTARVAELYQNDLEIRFMVSKAAIARSKLDHPLIDGDSHIIEYTPLLLDYIRDAGGNELAVRTERGAKSTGWYGLSDEEKRYKRAMRGPWWAFPTRNTLDRCTAMLPRLYYERMADFGLDFMVLYPTLGLFLGQGQHRAIACHAYNEYVADSYREFADKMTPVASIPMSTPEEALTELDHAHALGLKVAMIPSFVQRPVPRTAEKYPDAARVDTWLDSFGIDSAYDYDPVWQKCIELGFSVASHSGGMGFDDRKSISSYMYNHMGHFAAAGEVLAKSLLMGGVTARFPDLRIALMEGGVQNGVRLYADLFGRWQKRNPAGLENLNPANLDLEEAHRLFQEYASSAVAGKLDQLNETLSVNPQVVEPQHRDDFAAMDVHSEEDLRDRFIPNFYYGCEADDPMSSIAFDRRINPMGEQVRAIMSFDLGHWDVTDMTHAAAEAYEQVEDGLFSLEDFRKFGFENSVHLYADNNHDFFKGTAVESEAAEVLTA
ncbi:MAG: amidohydrolase family protein [Gammaproteobacteria bacterium]|jgi:predicted TIM-barrel fold metal-dependent hydrolase|nr:amidohydrolase family protein [Gammaproteobacteria bacterium]